MPMSQSEYDAIFGSAWHPQGAAIAKRLVYVEYSGVPTSNVTPEFVGQWCLDTANGDFYLATGVSNSDWKKIT